MANTPHVAIRVERSELARWKESCVHEETNVSEQVRKLMEAWCKVVDDKKERLDWESSNVDLEKVRAKYGI